MNTTKISRNDPCPCGSGKKYKQCCQNKTSETPSAAHVARLKESVPDLFNQALKAQQHGDTAHASELYQQIISVSPKHTNSLTNLGLLFLKSGQYAASLEFLEKAARLEPSAPHFNNLAQAYNMLGRRQEAKDNLLKAIQHNPGYAIAYNSLGTYFSDEHKLNEAIAYFLKAIQLNNRYDIAFGNLSQTLMKQGRYVEAADYFRQAIQLNPNEELHYRNLLFCLCFDSRAFPHLYLQEAAKLDTQLRHASQPYTAWLTSTQLQNQPLRIGLVSGDIRNHPVGYFLESIIQALDPAHIELYGYIQGVEDELTRRVKPYFTQWHNITALNNPQAAQKIHADGIHILIDLAGHTGMSRISMFTWKPAPIQVSWLGYFASTGLACMDYFLADPLSVPPHQHAQFSEKVWNLPETRLCFTAPDATIAPEVSPLPALKKGWITFGCFQGMSKINTQMLTLWAQILQACPNSQLMFKNHQLKDPAAQDNLREQCQLLGIAADRLILEEGGTRPQYFAAYQRVDLMLDTFPFPGGTTTCEALWMGVPTVTLAGDTLLARQGMAMLTCAGLADWVAHSEEQYVTTAIQHAHNLTHLSQLRAQLRQQVQQSPLMDAPRFARHFEQAMAAMWQQYTHKEKASL